MFDSVSQKWPKTNHFCFSMHIIVSDLVLTCSRIPACKSTSLLQNAGILLIHLDSSSFFRCDVVHHYNCYNQWNSATTLNAISLLHQSVSQTGSVIPLCCVWHWEPCVTSLSL